MRQAPIPNSGNRSHSGLLPRFANKGQPAVQAALRVN